MSYINDALHKVQKEKESSYTSYGNVVSAEGKKPGYRRKWLSAVGLLIVFLFAAGMITLLYWPEMNQTPRIATAVQDPGIVTAHPLRTVPPAETLDRTTSQAAPRAEVAAPPSLNIQETPATVKPVTAEVEEKKQNVVKAGPKPQKKALPEPLPPDVESLQALALQKHREGRLKEAEKLYRQVLKKNPRHLQALNNLGVVHLKLKKYRRAIIRFNDALEIKHNYVDAHYNLACLYAQKNDTKQSLFHLKNAMDINPKVREWVIGDNDLKNITDLPEFNKIMQTRDK